MTKYSRKSVRREVGRCIYAALTLFLALVMAVTPAYAGDTGLFAKWRIITYSITYDLDGGMLETENPSTYDVETDAFTLANPTRSGYAFKGWSGTGLAGDDNKTVTVEKGSTGDRSYTANWAQIFNITYDLNGGTGSTSGTYDSAKAFMLPTPSRTGYTFTGWTGSNGTTPQTSVTIPAGSTGDKSYKANWSLTTYTITYQLDGGTNGSGNPTSYTINSSTITIKAPTKAGYTFTGWTGSGSGMSVTIPAGSIGDKNYIANWSANPYILTFNPNKGSVSPTNRTVNCGASYGSLPTPTRSGYKFDGWYTSSSGGSRVYSSTKMGAGNTTIYAHWIQKTTLRLSGDDAKLIKKVVCYDPYGGTTTYDTPGNDTVMDCYEGRKIVMYLNRSWYCIYCDRDTGSAHNLGTGESFTFTVPSSATGSASLSIYANGAAVFYIYLQNSSGWVRNITPALGS